MKLVKLKDICEFEKGSTGLAKAEPGDYPLVATGVERKTSNTYQFDTKAVCIPLVSSTGHGHASLKNVHYQEGKFALGSILVALTAKDEDKLDIQFLHLYLSQLKDQVLVPLMSGAANVALSVSKIQTIEIPLPPLEKQQEIVRKFKSIVREEDELKSELNYQQNLLKKLRQQILQEAIEGKLTAEWRTAYPDIEPASELLKRIAAEKAQHIKDKNKLKNPLISINEEEKTFELPNGWMWCRLGHLFEVVRGSSPRPKGDPRYWDKNKTQYHWITIADFTPFGVNGVLLGTKGFLTQEGKNHSRQVKKGDLLIACSGVGSVGRSIQSGIDGYIYDGLLAIRNINDDVIRIYLKNFLKFKESQIYSIATGANWLNINIELLSNYVIPLPPLLEQKAIVAKVEKLFAICDQLESQFKQNQTHAEQLMHAVLKEAFSHDSKPQSMVNILEEVGA